MKSKTMFGAFTGLMMLAWLPLQGQTAWEGLQQLAGTWQREGKPRYEMWRPESDTSLYGEGYRLTPDGDKRISEFLRIVRKKDGGIAYLATVPGQNDGATIAFPMTDHSAGRWTFENPVHDFPQKIVYRLNTPDTLDVALNGAPGSQQFVLRFFRIPTPQSELTGYEVLVSSRNTGTVKRFDAATGAYIGEFGKEQIVQETQDLATGPDGMLYVTSLRSHRIMKFDPQTGAFLDYFSTGYDLKKPTKMRFDPDGYVYVSQWGEGQSAVVRFDAGSGAFDRAFTENLQGPLGHARDSAGNFYVACFYAKEVRKYSPEGRSLGIVTQPGQLGGPSNLWFGDDGNLMVADWTSGQIKRFRPDSAGFIADGIFAEGFSRLEGVAFGPDGYLYACDWAENVIRKIDPVDGRDLGIFLQGSDMLHPNALLFVKKGP
ncbi:MAG: NHL repeat-containing protein [Saprospiraceae bacterium]|nr:NHL repeat-containing protein [Saprospiraceae bacterium]